MQIPISLAGGGHFTINLLLTEKDDKFTDLSNAAKVQLQALLNANVTDDELKTTLDAYWELLSQDKDNLNNQNLVIGLGTAGGVVALAAVVGFAYWFWKIRKS